MGRPDIEALLAGRLAPSTTTNERKGLAPVLVGRRQGTVKALSATRHRMDVTVSGVDIPSLRYQHHVTPKVGDTVWVEPAADEMQVTGALGPTAWTALTPAGGTSNFGGGFTELGVRFMPGGWAKLRGTLNVPAAFASGTTIATLPADFRALAAPTGGSFALAAVADEGGVFSVLPVRVIQGTGAVDLLRAWAVAGFAHLDGCAPWGIT